MDSSSEDLGPTEGAVLALLDFLVDPLLPTRSSSRETVTFSQEVLVAKQVHAVVLLYNYYHRKQHPDLVFLDFQSFCKLAVVLKPSLQLYFRLMQRTDYAELDDPGKHLSWTEKAIMNACDTSKSLDASNNFPIIEGWPVTKVAIFLVDSRIENCYLFHSSITQGVWSAIEKEVNVPSQGLEAATEARSANKKKRVIKRASKENQTANLTGHLQLAYLAVKETCGINQCDLKILENHLVYSTSKAKTAVRLFIMQCMQTNLNVNLVPINDVMDSLQGPLVRKESISWIFTPVVEYFHLLPFADKVSDCLMRVKSQNYSQHFKAAQEDGNCNSFHILAEQLSNPSCHIEAVKEIENCSGPPSKEETPLNFPKQNCSIIHVKTKPFRNASEQNCTHLMEEPLLNIPESLEATPEVRNGNSNHLKEDIVPYASEARNADSCHPEKPLPHTSQHSIGLKEVSEAAEKVGDGNSNHIRKESLPYASQSSEAEKVVKIIGTTRRRWDPAEPVVYKKRNKSQKNSTSSKNPVSKTTNAPTVYPRQAEEQCVVTAKSHNMGILAPETDQTALTGAAIVVAKFPVTSSNEHDVEKILSDNRISNTVMSDQDGKQDRALVSFGTDFKHLRQLQLTIASKEKLISETALNVLIRKREQLSLQVRNIEDEIALCDKSIQTILNAGSEEGLAVKIDSILEGCNEICLKSSGADGDKTALEDQDLPPVVKRKRLSEANLCAQSPCQELDGICNANYWMLPTYSLSASEGGFQATVTVKGVDFECSSEGTMHKNPHEARNSAASNILVKMRSMAAES